MADSVETISFVARRLIQYEQKFALADEARRRNVSALFTLVARSLQALLVELNRDNLPHDPCRDLVLYSTQLVSAAEEELGKVEAERLATQLGEASDKEKIFLEFRSSDRRKYLIEELEKASILIQALANGIYMEAVPENETAEDATQNPL